jgi:iron(III) transport system substrate-binding protein
VTRHLTARLLAVLALAISLGLAACGDDDAPPGTDGDLVVYSGREEEYVAPLIERFEQQTGTKVDVRYGDTAELAATLVEEGDRSPADLFFAQDAGALGTLQKEGLFAPLPQATLERVPKSYRSPDGAWVGTSGRARVIAYDDRELTAQTVPRSVYELTEPQWKGKVGWAPTNASFQAFVTAMRKADGEDRARAWLEGMKANDTQSYEKNTVVRDAIEDGEIQLGLINHYYVLEAIEEAGADGGKYPVALSFPPGDIGSFVNVAGAGILKNADNTADAQRFLDFLLSTGSQRYFADEVKEYPLVEGVAADPALPALSSIEQPDVDLGDIDDLQGTLDLLQETGVL